MRRVRQKTEDNAYLWQSDNTFFTRYMNTMHSCWVQTEVIMEFIEANTMRAAKPPNTKMLKSLKHIIDLWQQHSGGQSAWLIQPRCEQWN